MDTTKKRSRIRLVALAAAAVAVLAGLTGLVAKTGDTSVDRQAVAQVESARSEFQASRSFNRDETPCPVFECVAARKAQALAPAPTTVAPKKPPVVKKKATTSPVGKGCSRLVATVWHGPCPKVSKDYAVATAKQQLAAKGWASQFGCFAKIVEHESGWNVYAVNPSSHSYGIPQALPGYKLAKAGPNWGWDAKVQIRWMIHYIAERYKTPCGAWSYWQAHNWY